MEQIEQNQNLALSLFHLGVAVLLKACEIHKEVQLELEQLRWVLVEQVASLAFLTIRIKMRSE